MGLLDSITTAESGGNPNATNPNSSATGAGGSFAHVSKKLFAHPHIGELFFAGCPSAVLRSVVAISINSVKRMLSAGARSHICEEIFKFLPALTNLNAFGAIVLVRNMARQATSPLHAIPNLVLRCCSAASGFGNRHFVGDPASADDFAVKAPTAFSVARLKVGAPNNSLPSAIAYAEKAAVSFAIRTNKRLSFLGGCQSTIFGADVIRAGH